MILLIFIIAVLIGFVIYYLTTLDFEVGSGFSERKARAKEAEYTVLEDEKPKEIAENKGKEVSVP